MKKMLKFCAIALLFLLVAVSCKKKETEVDITALPYAKESVDQGKTNLESAGQQMVSQLSTLADVNGVSGAQSMTYFMDQSLPFATSSQDAIAFAAVKSASDYGTSKNIEGIVQFLNSTIQSEKDSTFQELYNKRKGIYTWNNSLKKWTKTASTEKIELIFPSNKDIPGTNDGKFDLTYSSKIGTSTTIDSNGELPLSLDAVLYKNNDKVLEYSFTAQYDNNGIPTNVTTFLALYPFKFETTLTNNTSTVSLRYLFTNDTKTILDFYAGINGNFSQDNINNSQDPTDVVTNGNAYFQLFNIKLSGRVDLKGLAQKEKELDANTTLTEQQYYQADVDAMNQYFALVLLYADTNQKIAQAEFYLSTINKIYYTDYKSEIRFIFADNSKGDLKTYFGNGFKNLVTDFNALLIKLNNKYSLGAGTVTYTGN